VSNSKRANTESLDRREAASILGTVVGDGSFLSPSCHIYKFEGDAGRMHFQAVVFTRRDPSMYCLISLPRSGSNVYLLLGREDRAFDESVIAALEGMEARTELGPNTVVWLEQQPESKPAATVAVILLDPSLMRLTRHIPATLVGADRRVFNFLLVGGLTGADYRLWQQEGPDALLAALRTKGRGSIELSRDQPLIRH
jgi:hypothetical protein